MATNSDTPQGHPAHPPAVQPRLLSKGRLAHRGVVLLASAACVLMIGALTPAHGNPAGLVPSRAMVHLGHVEIAGAYSVVFSATKPYAFVAARQDGGVLVTLDVSMPASPRIVATLKVQSAKYAEDLDLAERADGTAFVLYGATDTPASNEDGLTIVDVSDPSAPRRIGGLAGLGSHTWTCVSKECTYAYGTVRDGQSFAEQVSGFAIVDLRNPHRPVVVGYQESLVSGPPPGVLHDWNADPAGVMWAVGHNGIAAYDATHPRNPQALNRSDANGEYLGSANNDRLQLHGSLRPNATSFVPNLGRNTASVHSGNVLLVSEEGDDQDCTDSFQTWYVPDLATFPEAGTITPLGSWSLAENTAPGLDRPAVHDDWCSVHWFDYHQDGFVVLAAYSAGTRIVNVNDPNAIGEVAYHFGESNAAWQSRWVPERDRFGRATGRATTLVYTADAGNSFVIETEATTGPPTTGGIDVFRATLP